MRSLRPLPVRDVSYLQNGRGRGAREARNPVFVWVSLVSDSSPLRETRPPLGIYILLVRLGGPDPKSVLPYLAWFRRLCGKLGTWSQPLLCSSALSGYPAASAGSL